MSWEIALGVIALAGFAGSIATWVSKLSKTLAVLETTISTLNRVLYEFRSNSHATHKEMYIKLGNHERALVDHEGRIKNLEGLKGVKHEDED